MNHFLGVCLKRGLLTSHTTFIGHWRNRFCPDDGSSLGLMANVGGFCQKRLAKDGVLMPCMLAGANGMLKALDSLFQASTRLLFLVRYGGPVNWGLLCCVLHK